MPPHPPLAATTDNEENTMNYVQETVLKKRRTKDDLAIQRRGEQKAQRQKRRSDSKSLIKKPEQFVQEFRQKELDLIQMKNRVRVRKLKQTTPESKLLFVIRVNGSNDMHPLTKKILKRLRLSHIFNGVFLKANEASLDMLVRVEPFVTYGYPNLRSVKELIYKKACGRVNKCRTPLTDNNIVEQALGEHGIICIEDIVHEISSVGAHFKEVTHFLAPLRLKKPEGRVLQKSKRPFKDGGDIGDRGDLINELISKMN